jgi:hypothetical protein
MRMPLLCVLIVAMVAAGCAGDTDDGPASFTAADAKRLSGIAPTSSDWAWPTKPSSTGVDDPDDEVPETADDPVTAELYDKIRDLEGLGGASSKWTDEHKLANLSVSAMGTPSDAQATTRAYREFLHAWGDDFGGVTKDEDVEGLGDEAWVIWILGNGNQVSYDWRRGNLVVSAHMHCYGICPSDVDGAAREWADEIDAELRSDG